MKTYHLRFLDCCNQSYFGGSNLPYLAVSVDRTTREGELKNALMRDLNYHLNTWTWEERYQMDADAARRAVHAFFQGTDLRRTWYYARHLDNVPKNHRDDYDVCAFFAVVEDAPA